MTVQDKIGQMLGVTLEKDDLLYGYKAVIRGKKYWFPSLTHAFDAARHGIGEYEVSESELGKLSIQELD